MKVTMIVDGSVDTIEVPDDLLETPFADKQQDATIEAIGALFSRLYRAEKERRKRLGNLWASGGGE